MENVQGMTVDLVKESPVALRFLNGCGEIVKICRCAVALHDGFEHGAGVAQIA